MMKTIVTMVMAFGVGGDDGGDGDDDDYINILQGRKV